MDYINDLITFKDLVKIIVIEILKEGGYFSKA